HRDLREVTSPRQLEVAPAVLRKALAAEGPDNPPAAGRSEPPHHGAGPPPPARPPPPSSRPQRRPRSGGTTAAWATPPWHSPLAVPPQCINAIDLPRQRRAKRVPAGHQATKCDLSNPPGRRLPPD